VALLALFTALPIHAADNRAIKSRVPPNYPEMAKRMRITGVVKLSVTVAPDGSVTAAKAISGNSMLTTAAEEAVSKWKFAPGAEESTVEVNVSFGAD
jgi:TonB family protein